MDSGFKCFCIGRMLKWRKSWNIAELAPIRTCCPFGSFFNKAPMPYISYGKGLRTCSLTICRFILNWIDRDSLFETHKKLCIQESSKAPESVGYKTRTSAIAECLSAVAGSAYDPWTISPPLCRRLFNLSLLPGRSLLVSSQPVEIRWWVLSKACPRESGEPVILLFFYEKRWLTVSDNPTHMCLLCFKCHRNR